jgi:hypothetical protein
VVTVLNSKDLLEQLNFGLKDVFLKARRVSVDPGGIELHKDFTRYVNPSTGIA